MPKKCVKNTVNLPTKIISGNVVFTKGPRGGKEYESDTYKLKEKLIT